MDLKWRRNQLFDHHDKMSCLFHQRNNLFDLIYCKSGTFYSITNVNYDRGRW